VLAIASYGDIEPSDGEPNQWHAFLSSGGNYKDLGTLGGAASWVLGMNNGPSPAVVGESYTASGQTHAFLYTDHMQDLGTLGGPNSGALAVGDDGTVVGGADIDAAGDGHAFIWTEDGGMVDLNTLIDPAAGWTIEDACAINQSGQIAGDGIDPSGYFHACLLTPISVPEPSALTLLAVLGVGALVVNFRNNVTVRLQPAFGGYCDRRAIARGPQSA
jgi:probable HAF family extracellular repeat protein